MNCKYKGGISQRFSRHSQLARWLSYFTEGRITRNIVSSVHRDHTPTCWLSVWTRLYLCTKANQKPTDPAWEKSSNRHTILFIFCLQYAYFSSKQWSYFNLYRRRGHHNILIYMFLYVAWEKPKKYEDSTYKYLKVLSKSKSVTLVLIFFWKLSNQYAYLELRVEQEMEWRYNCFTEWNPPHSCWQTKIGNANGLCITKKTPPVPLHSIISHRESNRHNITQH